MATKARKSASHSKSAATTARTWDSGVFLSAKFLMTGPEFFEAIQSSRWPHYVYGLCLDNGAVFYVGKGTNCRALDHAREAIRGEQSEKAEYIRRIGDKLRYTIFFQCEDDVFARGYEAYLIRGHHDVLANVAIPSTAVIDQMFKPLDLIQKAFSSITAIEEIIERGDRTNRKALLSVIADCPAVLASLDDETISWATGITDGRVARAEVRRKILEIAHGCQ